MKNLMIFVLLLSCVSSQFAGPKRDPQVSGVRSPHDSEDEADAQRVVKHAANIVNTATDAAAKMASVAGVDHERADRAAQKIRQGVDEAAQAAVGMIARANCHSLEGRHIDWQAVAKDVADLTANYMFKILGQKEAGFDDLTNFSWEVLGVASILGILLYFWGSDIIIDLLYYKFFPQVGSAIVRPLVKYPFKFALEVVTIILISATWVSFTNSEKVEA